jgi:hypothetical protein
MTSPERMTALHDRIQEWQGMLASGVGDEPAIVVGTGRDIPAAEHLYEDPSPKQHVRHTPDGSRTVGSPTIGHAD